MRLQEAVMGGYIRLHRPAASCAQKSIVCVVSQSAVSRMPATDASDGIIPPDTDMIRVVLIYQAEEGHIRVISKGDNVNSSTSGTARTARTAHPSRRARSHWFSVWVACLSLLLVVTSFPALSPAYADLGAETLPVEAGTSDLYSVAWGDWDGDGDLDLAVGNEAQANQVYTNDGGTLALAWESAEAAYTHSVAWGDWDGDGDLDLAVGNDGQANQVYTNDGGTLALAWESAEAAYTRSVAWGDWDNDGDLDLAVGNDGQANQVYVNDGGSLALGWESSDAQASRSVAWGDWDDDGDLDLAVGNYRQALQVYTNDSGNLALAWEDTANSKTTSVAWGDWDNDGDLDLAVGNSGQPNRVYENDAGALACEPAASLGWIQTGGTEDTRSVAWGDWDGDGDLDLAVGNFLNQPNQVYRNDGDNLNLAWELVEDAQPTTSVAWGDADGDGDLDLAVGNYMGAPQVHINQGNLLHLGWETLAHDATSTAWGDWDGDGDLDLAVGRGGAEARTTQVYTNEGGSLAVAWEATDAQDTRSVAWGDWDGDGDLDLAVGNVGQPNRVYANEGGSLAVAWEATDAQDTRSVAWGDWDGDGDLDLAVGNVGQPNRVYANEGGTMAVAWEAADARTTASVAWGDWDNDGDLDLAVGNDGQANQLYEKADGTLTLAWEDLEADDTQSVAWGDWDGDGDLDLAVGNAGQENRVYANDAGSLTPAWASTSDTRQTSSVAWGDWDGDGDLDLAVSNAGTASQVYANKAGSLTVAWEAAGDTRQTSSVAWGDWDGDGDLDLATATASADMHGILQVYDNTLRGGARLANMPPSVVVQRPGGTPAAAFYATPQQLDNQLVTISYMLDDADLDRVSEVRGYYSLNGGGQWFSAVPSDTITTNLETGVEQTYMWDTAASGFFGRSDNVVFRLDVSAPSGPFQHARSSAVSPPFRLRGTQIRVMGDDGQPVQDAIVYRLPVGQDVGGLPLKDETEDFLRTDPQGYLQGGVQLDAGDRLFALAPMRLEEGYTVYYTNGEPTNVGIETFSVAGQGVQELTVSADNPLILFHVNVSLEWDASNDPTYLQQMEFNLQRSSQYLYDFTNGQAALGDVVISQNADNWASSHILVQATNSLRPYAVQGGIVITPTVDKQHDDIYYDIGQVYMGSTWNRYGNPGQNLGDDWPIILAHELGHYLLFEEDVYLGLNPEGFLITVDTCIGSAMGDLYTDQRNTEFIADDDFWMNNCAATLANQTLERDEWDTITMWYPELKAPTEINAGPSLMPFNLTEIAIDEPITPTNALEDPTFYLDYTNRQIGSSDARVYIVRDGYVVDMGSPIGGQNRVVARGAQPGDQLCVYDRERRQYGCEVIELGDDRLSLEEDQSWAPVIQISPVSTDTLDIQVENLEGGLSMYAQLYTEYGLSKKPVLLTEADGEYHGTFALTDVAMAGNVRVWVDETATEDNPRRETMFAYNIGGNPGRTRSSHSDLRGSGGRTRSSHGRTRSSHGRTRSSHGRTRSSHGRTRSSHGRTRSSHADMRVRNASMVSYDGQMIFYNPNPVMFEEGQFYTIQDMAALPQLPPGRTAIGKGYNLVATEGTPIYEGTIAFEYMGTDVVAAGGDESALTIYFWDGTSWTELPTVRDSYYNLVSTLSQGPGVYALMSSVEISLESAGWNLIGYPVKETRSVPDALRSIDGYYRQVYGYDASDRFDPWKTYIPGLPPLFAWFINDLESLEFGKGYFINAHEEATLYLAHDTDAGVAAVVSDDPEMAEVLASMPHIPPATYYGVVEGDDTFAPTAGMSVVARVNGQVCSEGRTQEVDGQVIYVLDVPAEEPGFSTGCGAPGRNVTFEVGEQSLPVEVSWDNDRPLELTLQNAMQLYLPLVER
jgi:hypothetical protein